MKYLTYIKSSIKDYTKQLSTDVLINEDAKSNQKYIKV